MLYFLLRLFVYTFSASVVMNTVPGLRLEPVPFLGQAFTTVLGYVSVGALYAVLRDFVRPVILVLSGRLYIRSFGLLAFLIDVLSFLLITYIVPTEWAVGWARLGSAALGAVLMSILVLVLEALFGFDSPRAASAVSTPLYWRWLARLPGRRRNQLVESLRMRQLIAVFQSYSLDILMGLTPFGGFRHAMQKRLYRVRARLIERDPAVKLRLMLQQLGPTFIKFGQLIAARSELLPAAWRAELEKLQDEVQPVPYAEIEEVISRELGAAPEAVFAAFDRNPLAAASTAQVHAAELPGGERVVVKVQRPGIDLIVRADLNVLQELVDTAAARVPWLRRFGLGPLFHEFADIMRQELDFEDEAHKMRRLRRNMRELPFVVVPRVKGELSTARIITQERMTGVKISDVAALRRAGIDPEKTALRFFRALLKQLLFDGFFHADPHPGNVWVNVETGRIVFIDMGMMGRLDPRERLALVQLLWALREDDARLAARVLLAFCTEVQPAAFDRKALERDIERLLGRELYSAGNPDLRALTEELMGLLARYGLRLRQEFALGFKTLGQAEAIMTALLGPRALQEMVDITYRILRRQLLTELKPGRLADNLGKPLLSELIGRVPALLAAGSAFLDDFEQGRTPLQRQPAADTGVEERIARGQGLVAGAVTGASLLIGSALLLLVPPGSPGSSFLHSAAPFTAVAGAVTLLVLLVSLAFRSRGR